MHSMTVKKKLFVRISKQVLQYFFIDEFTVSVENSHPQLQYTYWNVVNRMCIQHQYVGIPLRKSYSIKISWSDEYRVPRISWHKKIFMRPHRQKSNELSSGDVGGQCCGPTWLVPRPQAMIDVCFRRCARIGIEVDAGNFERSLQ
jgi:hypothetical protein